jgi:hypothetical protein
MHQQELFAACLVDRSKIRAALLCATSDAARSMPMGAYGRSAQSVFNLIEAAGELLSGVYRGVDPKNNNQAEEREAKAHHVQYASASSFIFTFAARSLQTQRKNCIREEEQVMQHKKEGAAPPPPHPNFILFT